MIGSTGILPNYTQWRRKSEDPECPWVVTFTTMNTLLLRFSACECIARKFSYGTLVFVRNSLPFVEKVQIALELSGRINKGDCLSHVYKYMKDKE